MPRTIDDVFGKRRPQGIMFDFIVIAYIRNYKELEAHAAESVYQHSLIKDYTQ